MIRISDGMRRGNGVTSARRGVALRRREGRQKRRRASLGTRSTAGCSGLVRPSSPTRRGGLGGGGLLLVPRDASVLEVGRERGGGHGDQLPLLVHLEERPARGHPAAGPLV